MLVGQMDGAGDTGIEAVDGAQDLNRLRLIFQFVIVLQRGLVGTGLILRVTRACIPGRRHDRLIIVDLLILDNDEVRQPAARRLHEAHALGLLWPARRFPQPLVERPGVAGLDVGRQRIHPVLHLVSDQLGLQGARRGAAQGGEQRTLVRTQRRQRRIDQDPGRLVTLGIQQQHTRQRADLHRPALPAR